MGVSPLNPKITIMTSLTEFMMNFADAIGYLAASLTTAAFLPQVLKIWRSHSTKNLSLPMVIILVVGIALWLIYGLAIAP